MKSHHKVIKQTQAEDSDYEATEAPRSTQKVFLQSRRNKLRAFSSKCMASASKQLQVNEGKSDYYNQRATNDYQEPKNTDLKYILGQEEKSDLPHRNWTPRFSSMQNRSSHFEQEENDARIRNLRRTMELQCSL